MKHELRLAIDVRLHCPGLHPTVQRFLAKLSQQRVSCLDTPRYPLSGLPSVLLPTVLKCGRCGEFHLGGQRCSK